MKISEDRRMRLYNAIYDPIMDLRVFIEKSRKHGVSLSYKRLDDDLFLLESNLWNGIKKVLNFEEE